MAKNGVGSKNPETCCEKLYIAIRNTSPAFIKAVRFAKPITASSANVSVRVSSYDNGVSIKKKANLRDRCPRIFKQSVTPAPAPADYRKEADQKVSVIRDHKVPSPKPINQAKLNKPTVLPIHGHENRVPTIPHVGGKSSIAESIDGLSSDYIDSAGKRIRCPTNVGNKVSRDSFNDRVSEFIRHTKHKFHNAPSFNEGKGKRLK